MGGQASKDCLQGCLQGLRETREGLREMREEGIRKWDNEKSAEVLDAPKDDKVKLPSLQDVLQSGRDKWLLSKVEDKTVGEIPKDQERSAEVLDAPKDDKAKLPSEPMIVKEEEAPTEASTDAEELTEAPQVVLPVSNFSPSRKVEANLTKIGVTDEAPTEAPKETQEPRLWNLWKPKEAPTVEIPAQAPQVLETNVQEEPQVVLPVPEVPNFSPSREAHGQSGVEKLLDAKADKEPAVEILEKPVEALNRQSPVEPPQLDGTAVKSAAELLDLESKLQQIEVQIEQLCCKEQQAEAPNCKEDRDEDKTRNAEESVAATNKKIAALGAMTFLLALKSDA